METTQQKHFQRVILSLCFLITLLNYFDRSVISYAILPIKHEFSLNNAQFGLVMSMFALGCTVITTFAGILVDRFPVQRIWMLGVLFWSVVMIFLGVVQGFALFLILRFFLGIGEGISFPALNKTLLGWVTPRRMNTVLALSLLGVPLAGAIGSPLLSNLIIHYDWHMTFIILGTAGFLLVLAWLLFLVWYRSPKPIYDYKSQTDQATKTTVIKLLRNKTMLAICWAFFAFGYVLFFGVAWLPGYLEQTYHLGLSKIGLFLILPWAVSCVLMLLGGILSDYLFKKTNSARISRIYVICICQLIGLLFFLFHQS